MLNKKALLGVVFLSLVLAVCPLMYGQATGSFSGTVSDKAGAVISGATVTVSSQDTGLTREAKTDDSGHYLVPLLPVSNYTVRVQSQGFQTAEQKDVRLQIDEHRELDFSLAPASVSTSVEVSGTVVAVETANPTLGQVITSEQVADLPVERPQLCSAGDLDAGHDLINQPESASLRALPAAKPPLAVLFRFPRAVRANRKPIGCSMAMTTISWMKAASRFFSEIDDIQEFKVLTYNYSAEYGERAGPTVLVTTKSGSNKFHGSLFEFFRNTKLDARSYFASSKEQFNLNQFGGALAGLSRRIRLFLSRLPSEETAARHPVHGFDSDTGDDEWRFQNGSVWRCSRI
jgi:hypothetical protein